VFWASGTQRMPAATNGSFRVSQLRHFFEAGRSRCPAIAKREDADMRKDRHWLLPHIVGRNDALFNKCVDGCRTRKHIPESVTSKSNYRFPA
jgi:hypothetical protein